MRFLQITITALAASAIIMPPTKADDNINIRAGHHYHTASIDNVDLRSNNAGSEVMNAGAAAIAIEGDSEEDLDFTEVVGAGAISSPTPATGLWQRQRALQQYQFEYIGKGRCVSCDNIRMVSNGYFGTADLDACKAILPYVPNAIGLGYDSVAMKCVIYKSATIETVGRVDNADDDDSFSNSDCYKIFDIPCPTDAPSGMPSVMPSGMPSVMPSDMPSTSPSSSSAPSLPVGKANKKKKKAAKVQKANAPSTLIANELKSGGAFISTSPLVGVTFASIVALGVGSILL